MTATPRSATQRLHYVEAGEGAAGRAAARLPRVLVRLAAADRAARRGGVPRRGPGHARLQPVLEAGRRPCLRHRPADRRHRAVSSMNAAPSPRCWPVTTGAEASPGPPRWTTRRSWTGWPSSTRRTRGSCRRDCTTPASSASPGTSSSSTSPTCPKASCSQPLALLPALPARRPPGLHPRGDRPLHRGVVAARRGHRDDQLLPVLGADPAQEGRGGAPPDQGADPGHLGPARSLPRRGTRRARPRRRPQPRPRRAPARRVALGASRRSRARQPAAHRLLRPRQTSRELTRGLARGVGWPSGRIESGGLLHANDNAASPVPD